MFPIFSQRRSITQRAEQNELEYVIKSYEKKSRCKIILASTPNRPDYLFARIEKNEIFKDFFHKISLDSTHGLVKIFETDFIQRERERNQTYFERKQNLKYFGITGNVFSQTISIKRFNQEFSIKIQQSILLLLPWRC